MAKRFHVNLSVENIDASAAFYTTLFGAPPTVREPDYAKWMLDEPRVNFAISTHGTKPGIDHLGIQVDEPAELDALAAQLHAAGETTFDQAATTCCYAKSDKHWVRDPQGVAWETFRTIEAATTYGEPAPKLSVQAPCCAQPALTAAKEPAPAACCTA